MSIDRREYARVALERDMANQMRKRLEQQLVHQGEKMTAAHSLIRELLYHASPPGELRYRIEEFLR